MLGFSPNLCCFPLKLDKIVLELPLESTSFVSEIKTPPKSEPHVLLVTGGVKIPAEIKHSRELLRLRCTVYEQPQIQRLQEKVSPGAFEESRGE